MRQGGRKLTWEDVVKKDVNVLNISEHLDIDRANGGQYFVPEIQ